MAEFMVKCPVCASVVDATMETCPACEAALPAIPKPVTRQLPDSFAAKYAAEAGPEHVILPGKRGPDRSWAMVAVAAGVVLMLAVAVGSVFVLSGGAPAPTERPRVYGPPATPTPTASPHPVVAALVAQLNDPGFAAHVTVSSTYTVVAKLTANNKAAVVHGRLEEQISNGDASGTLTLRGGTTEFRLVDGTFYQRSGSRWAAKAAAPATIPKLPLFDIGETRVLAVVGDESLDGLSVVHLRTTRAWNADLHRVSLIETFHAQPQNVVLDVWATPDGTPVRAELHVATDASDGTHMMTIETRYDFTDPGVPVEILPPK